MTTITFELEAEVRNDIGKGASRRLRHADKIPAILYGAPEQPISLLLQHNKVAQALAHEAFYSHILTLKIGNSVEKVILKDIQRHPSKPRIQHMDFLRVKADQKLHMHVPLHFIGEEKAPGVKNGGLFSHLVSDVEVSCLPANLPEFIEVDVSAMELDQTLHLSDLKLPKGVELVALAHGIEGHDLPVISIHIPHTIDEEPIESAENAADATDGTKSNDTATSTDSATGKSKE